MEYNCHHCNNTGIIIIDRHNYLNYTDHYNISMIDRQFILQRYQILHAKCKFCSKSGNLLGILREQYNNK